MRPQSRSVLAPLVAVALVTAACGGGGGAADAPTAAAPPASESLSVGGPAATSSPVPPAVDESPTPTAAPSPSASPSPDPADLRVALEEVDVDVEAPVFVLAHDDRTIVVEQPGRVTDLDTGETWLDITDRVVSGGERGLLGVDVHPSGGHAVVHYSGAGGATTLSTFLIGDAGLPDPDSETVVLSVAQPAPNHNGGTAVFGPDGLLWLGLGDGGAAGDRFGNGQDPSTLLGALLRLDLDDPTVARVPASNPFADGDGGAPEVWAYGLRNPYRIALDDEQVHVADVGQDAREEVTVLTLDQAGANLGWPAVEGDVCHQQGCDLDAYENADVVYGHDTGACSVIGGLVYEGDALPALGGHFLHGDLCSGILRTVRAEDGEVVDGFDLTGQVGGVGGVTGIGADADGEPVLTFGDGRVQRLVPAG